MHPGVMMFMFTFLGGELVPLMLRLGEALRKDTEHALWGVTLATLQFMLGDLYLLGGEQQCLGLSTFQGQVGL